jgi:hypothetical protein
MFKFKKKIFSSKIKILMRAPSQPPLNNNNINYIKQLPRKIMMKRINRVSYQKWLVKIRRQHKKIPQKICRTTWLLVSLVIKMIKIINLVKKMKIKEQIL